MSEQKTATEALRESDERRLENILHHRMKWFAEKYAPEDRRKASEFHADLTMVIQAVHADASRTTHALLEKALAAMPPAPIFVEKK